MMDHMLSIMRTAQGRQLHMLVDAEQTYLQPAVDACAFGLARAVNRRDACRTPAAVTVFNTYQCYLKGAVQRLSEDLEVARQHDFLLGVKVRTSARRCRRMRSPLPPHALTALPPQCVRGAYMVEERAVAAAAGKPSPIHDSKAETDSAYDNALRITLDGVASGYAGLLVASHNQASMEAAMAGMRARGVARSGGGVWFGQLQGMCDHLTAALATEGYDALKCLPYGPVASVVPYLVRRAQENSSALHVLRAQRQLLGRELRKRLLRV